MKLEPFPEHTDWEQLYKLKMLCEQVLMLQ